MARQVERAGKGKVNRAKAALLSGANRMRNEATESIRTPGGQYRFYPGDAGGGPHWSAPPGEAPNADTGTLQNNIVLDIKKEGELIFVRSRAKYSKHLELGTRFMQPRPFMGPAFRRIIKGLRAAIRKAIKRG